MSKDYSNDFLGFFQDLYKVEGAYGPTPLTPPFLVEFLGLAFKDGKPAARNILDARTKKQGKSALAGAVALYMASRQPYAEVVIAASDRDQAKDRVLRAVKFACENGPLASHAKVYNSIVELDNRSIIQALPMDWAGAAGGNYSCCVFDELHGYVYEQNRRMFDELIPPPTQPDAVRWIASYAGFLGESELLKDWWDRGLQGEQISENLPIYHNQKAGLLSFIDTGEESWRMPWMTQEYIEQIRESERDLTFQRLWLNVWTTNESSFVPMEAWQRCHNPDIIPLAEGDNRKIVLGLDASTTRDLTALVGTWTNNKTKKAEILYVKAYTPKRGFLRKGKPTIDLEAVKDEVLRLHKARQLNLVIYDPYQFASIAIELERAGVRMIECPQTNMRTEADQQLYDSIISGAIQHFNHPELNAHIRNSIAIESVRGFRLAKDKTSMKIDLAVALSMSLYGLRKYAPSGNTHTFSDFLDLDHDNYGYHTIDSVQSAFVVDKHSPRVHAPGITWENCKYRENGCRACIDELAAAGYYKDENAFFEDPNFIYSGVEHVKSINPANDEAYTKSQKAQALFRKNVANRLKE